MPSAKQYQLHKEYYKKYQETQRKEWEKTLAKVKSKGCKICGYNKCLGALSLHHRKPEEKIFAVNNSCFRKNKDMLKKEIYKCDVLCVRCHAELHWREQHDE